MKYLRRLTILTVVGVVLFGSVNVVSAIGRCKGAYHFVHTPTEASFDVTGCVKLTWKTVLYGYVPDTAEAQPLFTSLAPKSKGSVELDVITVDADTLADAVNRYLGGDVPDTLSYSDEDGYFSDATVGINDATDTSSRALDTTVYSFDGDHDYLYILTIQANRERSAFGRQALQTAKSLTVDVD